MAAAGGVWGSAPAWATGLPGRLHDFVKTVLLQQLVSPGAAVCDLLCGRGTDTAKWAAAGIGSYIGLDLSASALQDAEEEWKTHGQPYAASFCQLDPFLAELESKLQGKELPFDTVCCLGHLQDSFSSEDKVKQLLQNVVNLLKSGGFFFGITADASTLWSKYQKAVESALKSGALRYGAYPRVKAELYNISFEDDRFNIFGTKYQLRFIDDGLAPQSQLLVHFPSLIRLAKEAGLEYIEIQNLDEFFEDYRSLFSEAFAANCSTFLDPKGKLMAQIRDVLSLYTTFIFRKADIYSPGRLPMPVNYELKEPVPAATITTGEATKAAPQPRAELRAFSRRSHKQVDGDGKKKPGPRKEQEAVETPVPEAKELKTYERSQRDSKKASKTERPPRRASLEAEEPTSSSNLSKDEEMITPRPSAAEGAAERAGMFKEEETVEKMNVASSSSMSRDEEGAALPSAGAGCDDQEQEMEIDAQEDEASVPDSQSAETAAGEHGSEASKGQASYEYTRRSSSHNNRWSKSPYAHPSQQQQQTLPPPPPPPPPQHHHPHYSTPEELEIRAEMEAAQRRLNVPSILGPGPTPLMIHAYRRDGSRNFMKERTFHR